MHMDEKDQEFVFVWTGTCIAMIGANVYFEILHRFAQYNPLLFVAAVFPLMGRWIIIGVMTGSKFANAAGFGLAFVSYWVLRVTGWLPTHDGLVATGNLVSAMIASILNGGVS